MPYIYVDTLDDPRLDVFARLTEAQLRCKLEPERAVFIAESGKVIERAFEGGMEPLSLLMEEKWLDSMEPLISAMEKGLGERATSSNKNPGDASATIESTGGEGLPVFIAPHDELERLTGFELTRGALGAFRRPALPPVADVLRDARLVAVLEDITNHTNVGAIFRSAAALGVDAVLASPACYDPLYRRAVRVSMGTVFQVPWTRIGDENVPNRPGEGTWSKQGIAELHEYGFACAAMALSDDSVTPDELNALLAEREAATGAPAKLALLFGTEGDGLSPATIARCDYTVRIPMAHGVDSLNVAASSAVAFYAFRQLSQLGREAR
ncbi:RNA methyltransferase [Adlercreutzia sp. R25]|uniref:RNA methyltransferase n=1 Tax=Adlercreutzia shanghongiae TaxID=3111773 RepID=A0ABU6J1F6_9ACTN|nr:MULTISPECIES: RNA methyltransferase [unclassified Adlercreutzia]MEC4273729.1 RNA methyltransferase [Adlercreutzia sp. R25]MEC4295870.1 RNA methyltransferase [Adlercreutzia sp. R22]